MVAAFLNDVFRLNPGRKAFQVACSILPLYFGTLWPLVGAHGMTGGFINPVWGSLYGLYWYVAGFAINLRNDPGIGAFLWPALVTWLLYRLSGKFWDRSSRAHRFALLAVLMLTLAANVTGRYFNDSGLWRYFPVWWNQFVVIW
jgi:hypothetical protein